MLVNHGSASLPQFPRLIALEWSLIVCSQQFYRGKPSWKTERLELFVKQTCSEHRLLICGLGSGPREGKRPARKLFISQEGK